MNSAPCGAMIRALREHASQMGDWDPAAMIAGLARREGARYGLRAAEAFRRMIFQGAAA